MLARILVITGLVSAGLLLIILTTTTPSTAGAFGILSVFLLSYIVVLVCFTFLLRVVALLIDRAASLRHLGKRYNFTLKKSYYYSSVIALGPVIVVSLQSVGGVGLYELILIILFIIIGCLYISRRTA